MNLKIGMICYPTYGGSGVVAAELGQALGERGHEIHFISYARPFRLAKFQPNVYYHEVEEVSYPLFKYPPYTLLLANKIVEIAEHAGLDLLHVHYAMPHSISAYLAKQLMERTLPLITTLHGTDVTLVGTYSNFFRLTRFALQASDAVTAVSQALAEDTLNVFGPLDKRIFITPNFVDPSQYLSGGEKGKKYCLKCFAPRGEKILTHISNFRPVKRVPDVINIFAQVEKQIPAVLLLVGDGPEMGQVERQVQDLELHEKVIFMGNQDNVQDILQVSDLFLLPSGQESFGLAALEAMACGVPVIGSRVGGLPEVVLDGETGFLLETGDIRGMSEKALTLLRDPVLNSEYSRRAASWAISAFPKDKMVTNYEDIYYGLLDR